MSVVLIRVDHRSDHKNVTIGIRNGQYKMYKIMITMGRITLVNVHILIPC